MTLVDKLIRVLRWLQDKQCGGFISQEREGWTKLYLEFPEGITLDEMTYICEVVNKRILYKGKLCFYRKHFLTVGHIELVK